MAYALPGWQDYAIVRDDVFTTKIDDVTDLRSMMSVFGATGAAAYFGLLDIGQHRGGRDGGRVGRRRAPPARSPARSPRSTAAGWSASPAPTRSAPGSSTSWASTAASTTAPPTSPASWPSCAPTGSTCTSTTSAVPILDAVLGRLNQHGRVVLCGAISTYNDQGRPPGPANYLNLISRRGRMEGFITLDYWDRFPECFDAAAGLGRRGPAHLARAGVRGTRRRARGAQRALHRRQHRQGHRGRRARTSRLRDRHGPGRPALARGRGADPRQPERAQRALGGPARRDLGPPGRARHRD